MEFPNLFVRPQGARTWVTLTCVVPTALLPTVSAAQDDDAFVLPELVFEGTKVEREFVDTTESVGVLTGEQIAEQGIDDLRDGLNQLGNVRLFEGNRGENGFTIRGLNSEGITESFNNAPLTSVIIDGAIQSTEATRRGARGLWDVEQVEVYRGPQSTLQGRGSLAGAVIVETKSPTFEFEGEFRGVVGQDDRADAAFVVSGPISDQLAFRLSGETRSKTRDITFNLPANEIIGEDRFRNLRGKLLYEPAEIPGLSLEFTLSDTFDRPGVNAVNSANFFDRQFNVGPNPSVEIREANNLNATLKTTYAFGETMELTAITAFIDSETTIRAPAGSAFARDEFRGGEDFTQDVRLTFGNPEDEVSGVVGLFYGNFTLPRESLVTVDNITSTTVIQDLRSRDRTESFGIYGDVRWRFADNWILLAGGRYSYENVTEDITGVANQVRFPDGSTAGGVSLDVQNSASFDVFLPKLGVAYEFDDFRTLSFTIQEGYRSGFTEVVNGAVNVIEPEFLTSYELGYKAEDPNGNWRFGATAFLSEYRDQQIVVAGTPVPQTVNAGESRIYGAELEGSYSFGNGLDVFGSAGLLKTEFTDFVLASGDLTGNQFPEAPAVTASIGANYEAANGFFVSATASYTDTYYSTGSIENDPALLIDSFTRVDAQIGYEVDNIRFTLYADNLFDSDYVTSKFNTSFGAAPIEATVSDPRTIGFEISAKF